MTADNIESNRLQIISTDTAQNKSIPNTFSSFWTFNLLSKLILLLGLGVTTFPPTFIDYGSGLDAGWIYAINFASAEDVSYGCDFVFTYGPLGFICCPMDMGKNLAIAAIFRIAIHITWIFSIGCLGLRLAFWRFAAFIVCAGMAAIPAINLDCDRLGVLLSTVVYLLVAASANKKNCLAIIAAILVGASVLIKANIGAACGGALVGYCLYECTQKPFWKKILQSLILLIVAIAVTILLALPYINNTNCAVKYVRNTLLITQGYSSHMSIDGAFYKLAETPKLIAGATLLIFASLALSVWSQRDLISTFLIIAFPIFLYYKSAVVRCDEEHWRPILFHTLALLAILLVRARTATIHVLAAIILILSVFVFFSSRYQLSITDRVFAGPNAILQLVTWDSQRDQLKCAESGNDFEARRRFSKFWGTYNIPSDAEFTWLSSLDQNAVFDIYPYDILISRRAKLNWKHRFVPQSYAAFHPQLDDRSASNFRYSSSPDYVVYHHSAIDGYHPFTVDPLTFTELIRWYKADLRLDQNYLLLRRRASIGLSPLTDVSNGVAHNDAPILVPELKPDELCFLKLEYKMTIYGKIANALYRIMPPLIQLHFADGTSQKVEVSWQNAKSGILVSQFPINLDNMQDLLERKEVARVVSVTLMPSRAFESGALFNLQTASWE